MVRSGFRVQGLGLRDSGLSVLQALDFMALRRVYGNMASRDSIGIIHPNSLLRTSKSTRSSWHMLAPL